jgi:hypothetical protein
MSTAYLSRLNGIAEDYDACRNALSLVHTHFDCQQFSTEVAGLSRRKIKVALDGLEAIYIVPLFAEFEGILKDHLRTNHPSITFDEAKARVDWLLGRVLQREKLKLSVPHRRKFDAVRDYRNRVAQLSSAPAAPVPFSLATHCLEEIVGRFPDPYYA